VWSSWLCIGTHGNIHDVEISMDVNGGTEKELEKEDGD